jgi:NAD-dependent oxidoreductase involved in siderophore biosynthesis
MHTRPSYLESTATVSLANDSVLTLADVCYEMFSTRELRHPDEILLELHSAFPEISEAQRRKAIEVALSWKRIMRKAGKLAH